MKIIQFGAIWCVNCVYMKNVWEEIAGGFNGMDAEYYDADDNPDEFNKYSIKDIPVFIFFDSGGNEFMRLNGAQSKEELIKIIKENLDK